MNARAHVAISVICWLVCFGLIAAMIAEPSVDRRTVVYVEGQPNFDAALLVI